MNNLYVYVSILLKLMDDDFLNVKWRVCRVTVFILLRTFNWYFAE